MESSLLSKLGSSLPVPSVQEMVEKGISQVPLRYVRPNQDPAIVSTVDAESSPQLPIIDMERLTSPDFMGSEELERLDQACKDWGFFQLINHGEMVEKGIRQVPLRYVRPIQDPANISTADAESSPQLPIIDMERLTSPDFMGSEELERLDQACKDWGFFQLINHGVNSLLVEKAFVVSENQKLEWADMFGLYTLPTHIRKPHLLPMLPLQLRDGIEVYAVELEKLALKLLEFMAKALKMDANEMRAVFEGGHQAMRMNYYPPCPEPDLVIGISPHSDIQGITILLQVNEVEGLQIKKDGRWVAIKPLSGAFLVNVGDSLEIVTNGIYKSIEHRTIVNSVKERLSIATFYSPNLDREIGPASSLITSQNPTMYKRIGFADFCKLFASREL
ncbi:hypothetical protein Nepgr_021268 [Nepenthes gracilis]|uniref:Fe2OG dioxygenase domain-containing protein n=1 Tax=Nepenthes gracilis TaxID=150966 RepID=A0AAD3SZJ4_NEPGR|nr:hypothetical protein Nepgr_021268 [Nepenthes gracilis]